MLAVCIQDVTAAKPLTTYIVRLIWSAAGLAAVKRRDEHRLIQTTEKEYFLEGAWPTVVLVSFARKPCGWETQHLRV